MRIKLPALLLSASLSLFPLAGPASSPDLNLPDLGTSAGGIMTPKAEQELGKAFMRNVRRQEAVLEDPLVDDYLQELAGLLLRHGDAARREFRFFVIDNPEINAFAGPGGHIGVYTGLILTTETESELAAVLAHEIAHVTQQHLLRAWETAGNLSVPTAAVLIASIALGVVAGGDAGIAAASAGQAALIQNQINFTRSNEQEADRIGIDILGKAGLDVNAMPAFFARMGKANRVYASELPEFLRTHPVTTNRISDALNRASSHPYKAPRDDLRYQLLKIRLTLKDERLPQTTIAAQQRLLQEGRYRNRLAAEYQLAMLLAQAERIREADRMLTELLRQRPEIPEFVIAKADIEQRSGEGAKALKRLQQALAAHPGSRAFNLAYAEQAMRLRQFRPAQEQLMAYLKYAPDDPDLYGLLARLAGETGDKLDAHLYQAENHYLRGRLDDAILQLEIAGREKGLSFYDASRLESRLEEMRREKSDAKKRE